MAETRNPGLVKEVMGHESLNTTMGYLHPEVLQIKQVIYAKESFYGRRPMGDVEASGFVD